MLIVLPIPYIPRLVLKNAAILICTVCYCLIRVVCLSFIYIFIIRSDGVSGVFIDKGIPREIPYWKAQLPVFIITGFRLWKTSFDYLFRRFYFCHDSRKICLNKSPLCCFGVVNLKNKCANNNGLRKAFYVAFVFFSEPKKAFVSLGTHVTWEKMAQGYWKI